MRVRLYSHVECLHVSCQAEQKQDYNRVREPCGALSTELLLGSFPETEAAEHHEEQDVGKIALAELAHPAAPKCATVLVSKDAEAKMQRRKGNTKGLAGWPCMKTTRSLMLQVEGQDCVPAELGPGGQAAVLWGCLQVQQCRQPSTRRIYATAIFISQLSLCYHKPML